MGVCRARPAQYPLASAGPVLGTTVVSPSIQCPVHTGWVGVGLTPLIHRDSPNGAQHRCMRGWTRGTLAAHSISTLSVDLFIVTIPIRHMLFRAGLNFSRVLLGGLGGSLRLNDEGVVVKVARIFGGVSFRAGYAGVFSTTTNING